MTIKNNLDLALIMCPGWGVIQPPVGISYLKGFLKNSGIRVKCFDFSLQSYQVFNERKYWDLNYPEHFITPQLFEKDILPTLKPYIETWAEEILSYNPQLVGFSLFMSSTNASVILAQYLKKLKPELIILGGGPEATRLKRVILDKIEVFAPLNKKIADQNYFDFLVEGEGEKTLLEILFLIKQGRDFHSVEGILYNRDGKVIANTPRKLIDNLDILAYPDYEDFELGSYTRRTLPIVTSRGCINRCTFCADSPLWKIYRYRSAQSVLEEIKFLIKKYHIRDFEIVDSTFNGDIHRLEEICNLIIESNLDIRWSAKATLRKEMNTELLQKMKKAGCTSLGYGVESGSPRVLQDMRKNTDLNEIKRIIKDTYKAGIQANCFFIIGYPTETEGDFQLTLNFIQENAEFIHHFQQVTGCHIEEDSYLGLNLSKYGIIFEENGWHSSESTPEIRINRLQRFKEFARKLHKHYRCEVQL